MKINYPNGTKIDDSLTRTEQFFERYNNPGTLDTELAALVQQGICLDATSEQQHTPLHCVAMHNRTKTAQALISAGANIESGSHLTGKTPLMVAATVGIKEMIKTLLAAGANIEALDKYGSTPLLVAAMQGRADAVRTLLTAGANIDARDFASYYTVLSSAVGCNDKETVDVLIEAGAPVEAWRDKRGRTPFNKAVYDDRPQAIMALFARGANIYTCDVGGVAPFECRALLKAYNVSWSDQYQQFISTRRAPASTEEVYLLLSCTPLANPYAQVDYTGNLRRIFAHAKWENREQAESILKEMRSHGTVSTATCESILAATFPPERVRSATRSQTASVGVAI